MSKIPLIEAVMCFDDNNNASVDFEILHPDMLTMEYARLSLLYYAKTLYTIDPKQKEAPQAYVFLLDATRRISEAENSKEVNILKVADVDAVVHIGPLIGKKQKYTAKMTAVSQTFRSIWTTIPLRGILQQFTFSVPLLIAESLKYCDISDFEVLKLGLKYMNKQYVNNNVDFRKLSNLVSVPIEAFMDAFLGIERKILYHYVFFICKRCDKKLKLPKGKGKIRARCPNCQQEIMVDTFDRPKKLAESKENY